jgi:C-terminal processing protease CtpA/Prc
MGTTFVELIKRPGTYLGVVVSDRDPRIAQLVAGSWAQRSDVLCVGDKIISVNGLAAESLSQDMLGRTLDESDRIQLEVRYRLPIQISTVGKRRKVIQV